MRFDEYAQLDAIGMATLVRQGEVSADELLAVAMARADAVNPRINAIIRRLDQHASERAKGLIDTSGVFAGVPFLVKDLLQDIAGEEVSGGSRALIGQRATQTADVTARWEAAGLITFGMTNTPELGSKGVTEPLAFGPTRNPWALERTPGGSSGGSAAAVAAGIVPMAGGNDGGGSIRIPAAACGLFGLKPSRGLVSVGPAYAEAFFGGTTQGVISRSVRDTAASLDVLAGATPGSPYLTRGPETSYLQQLSVPVRRLRIGFSTASFIGTPVHQDAVDAVQQAASLLAGLGHDVEEAAPRIDGRQVAKDWFTAWCCMIAREVAHVQETTGASSRAFEPDTRAMAAAGRTVGATELMATLERWHLHTQALARFHAQYDFWLTPTVSAEPLALGALNTPPLLAHLAEWLDALGLTDLARKTPPFEKRVFETMAWSSFTQLANITGRPAMSVPLYWNQAGLPLGVHFIGALHTEPLLLQLAAQLEQTRPWAYRRPAL
ncbi:MAG: amidase [Aquabacterium sp.]|nr:amidase [Aquabacterium sp.]